MSTSPIDTLRFRLPEGRELEVVVIRLADGRLVVREASELEAPKRPEGPATSPASPRR